MSFALLLVQVRKYNKALQHISDGAVEQARAALGEVICDPFMAEV